jgi:CheY-like chemotaxis protein
MITANDNVHPPDSAEGSAVDREGLLAAASGPSRADLVSHSHELIGRLASGIVHDFNKLLTILLGNLSLLRASLAAVASQDLLLASMENAANQAADLTRQLLALTRHESPRTEPVDLNAVSEQVAGLLRHTIDPRIELVLQPRVGLRLVLANRGRITRVLLNLCLNACDAMPQGGRLRIATDEVLPGPAVPARAPGSEPDVVARLTVEDTGAGIPEEVQARIFDPDFTTKQPGVGMGLGLAIVAGLVREHGGWVDCHSACGKGTRFDVYLPVQRHVPAAAAGGATVLVVESNEQVRELARTVLEKDGYSVVVATDGRQAIESFRRAGGKVAVVILEHQSAPLPTEDTLSELRLLDPRVRVVVVNGPMLGTLAPVSLTSVDGSLAKPFRPAELLAAVRAALAPGKGPGDAPADMPGVSAGRPEPVAHPL